MLAVSKNLIFLHFQEGIHLDYLNTREIESTKDILFFLVPNKDTERNGGPCIIQCTMLQTGQQPNRNRDPFSVIVMYNPKEQRLNCL